MLQQISKILTPIIRIGADPNDSEELRFRKIIGVMSVLLGGFPVQVGFGILFIYFGEPVAGWILVGCGLLMLLGIFTFAASHKFNLHNLYWLLITVLSPFIVTLVLGGFAPSGFTIIWALLAPLIALITNRPQHALFWFLLFVVEIVSVAIAQPYLNATNNLPPSLIVSLYAINTIASSGLFLFSLYYFVGQNSALIRLLKQEQDKSNALLLNILPKEIATILRNEIRVIADHIDEASILFADMVNFTPMSAKMAPIEMVTLLNEVFSYFDYLAEKYGVEKIRTIGDCYMVAAGVPRPRYDHAHVLARLALDIQDYVRNDPTCLSRNLNFRIGINSGPVVAGVIGRSKFQYDLWGDVVNTASRMESHGVSGQIQIPVGTYDLIKDSFICEPCGVVMVKGKGEMKVWHVLSEKG
jgi:guanylate cyclase